VNATSEYHQRLEAAERAARVLDRRGARLAHARVAAFLGSAVPLVLTLFGRLPPWGYGVAMLAALAYVALAVVHDRVLKSEARVRATAELNRRSLARLDGGWRQFQERGEKFLSADHPYTADLNLFGPSSLFQLMDETATRGGEAQLAEWLLRPSPRETVVERQSLVKELAGRTDFRQALQTELRLLTRDKADPQAFIAWAEGPSDLRPIRWARWLAWPMPLATLLSFMAGRLDLLPRAWFWATLAAQATVVALTARPLARLYRRIISGEQGFLRFDEVMRHLETSGFQHPGLRRLSAVQGPNGALASTLLKRFGRLFAFAELRQSAQLYAVIQLLTLWDLHWLFRLEDWKRACGPQVRGWFSSLAQMEALLSLAGFTHDRSGLTFPELAERGAPRFVAVGLGHPLLDHPVPNDVTLDGQRRALLVTGSNMSGKSTLLRAVGVNAVLAQAGAPVCADALTLSPLAVFTSMRLTDSLERGVSYFYAEVQRLRAVWRGAVEAQGQALFLLDEILLGTNTRERQVASREVLRLLLRTGAVGAVTTHDLSLAELGSEPGLGVVNVHFRDLLVEGRMAFDYRMQNGVADSTNALRVLREAGLPIGEGP